MTNDAALQTALNFLSAYSDPGIKKRLYFEVWSDRRGLSPLEKRSVWHEVRRITYKIAAEKREETRLRKVSVPSRLPLGIGWQRVQEKDQE